jgi:hypothetical protein
MLARGAVKRVSLESGPGMAAKTPSGHRVSALTGWVLSGITCIVTHLTKRKTCVFSCLPLA